jgi:hypothetical protein
MRRHRIEFGIGLLTLLALAGTYKKSAYAEPRYMYLTVADFEQGISYRQAQWHAPIGHLINPCAYADRFTAAIDWNDGSGEHKPDANFEQKMIQKTPAVQSGTYLFWDDEHVSNSVGTQIVTTKLVVHCLGDPPQDHEYLYQNVIAVHPRIPVNEIEFTKNGEPVYSVKGHDTVDLTITLNSPAPASGTWVKLIVTPAGNLNSLPPYIQIPEGNTQETISNLEMREPRNDTLISVSASTVGRAQESHKLTVTP